MPPRSDRIEWVSHCIEESEQGRERKEKGTYRGGEFDLNVCNSPLIQRGGSWVVLGNESVINSCQLAPHIGKGERDEP